MAHNINKKDILYIIDLVWIKNWKEYSGYNSVFKNFENIKQSTQNSEKEFEEEIKEMCDNMVLTQEINNIDNNKSYPMDNGSYGYKFIHKIIFELEDFDSLVDENTYNLFKELSGEFDNTKTICIKGFILDKLIALLIKEEKK